MLSATVLIAVDGVAMAVGAKYVNGDIPKGPSTCDSAAPHPSKHPVQASIVVRSLSWISPSQPSETAGTLPGARKGLHPTSDTIFC